MRPGRIRTFLDLSTEGVVSFSEIVGNFCLELELGVASGWGLCVDRGNSTTRYWGEEK
jgi:hypothetical protein